MKQRDDEVTVTYIVHGGDPKKCRRCYSSIRPPCVECGHALTAEITLPGNWTICEFCKTRQQVKKF